MPCTVDGTTSEFGNVSFDCPASSGGNIANFDVPLDLTTGTHEIQPTATCTGSGGGSCWCPDQQKPNACDDGVCTVGADGEGALLDRPDRSALPARELPLVLDQCRLSRGRRQLWGKAAGMHGPDRRERRAVGADQPHGNPGPGNADIGVGVLSRCDVESGDQHRGRIARPRLPCGSRR